MKASSAKKYFEMRLVHCSRSIAYAKCRKILIPSLKYYSNSPKLLDPWLVTEFEETLHGHSVRWTRPGRRWTANDRRGLMSKFLEVAAEAFPGSPAVSVL